MINRNIQMKKKNEDKWENLFPLSLNENIFDIDGNDLNKQMTNLSGDINTTIDTFKKTINKDITDLTNSFNTFNTKMTKDFNQYKKETTNHVNSFKKNIPPNHINSDHYSNLQEAIYAAENGVLHIKKGTYNITTPIKIRSNTTIYAYGSVFKRNANIDHMFINDSNGSKGGYNANVNIEIIGGIFDASGGSYSDQCTILVFGHARNIKILQNEFKNLRDWHMVEVNACQNVLIEDNIFSDYGTSTKGTEMLQIDISKNTGTFPWFGPYDSVTCDNITIKQNKFIDGVRAIGTHTSANNTEHTRISILENEFVNMRKEAINGLDWAFVKIHENHFNNVFKGVVLNVQGQAVNNHSIIGNYIAGNKNSASRGIQITGVVDSFGIQGGSIKNNKIKRFGSHAIGVDYSSKWVIEGNEMSNNGQTGIILWGAEYSTVSANVGLSNEQEDIVVREGSKNIVVTGNNIARVRVFNNATYVFFTSNTVRNGIDFSESTTRVMKNNFINGVYKE